MSPQTQALQVELPKLRLWQSGETGQGKRAKPSPGALPRSTCQLYTRTRSPRAPRDAAMLANHTRNSARDPPPHPSEIAGRRAAVRPLRCADNAHNKGVPTRRPERQVELPTPRSPKPAHNTGTRWQCPRRTSGAMWRVSVHRRPHITRPPSGHARRSAAGSMRGRNRVGVRAASIVSARFYGSEIEPFGHEWTFASLREQLTPEDFESRISGSNRHEDVVDPEVP